MDTKTVEQLRAFAHHRVEYVLFDNIADLIDVALMLIDSADADTLRAVFASELWAAAYHEHKEAAQ